MFKFLFEVVSTFGFFVILFPVVIIRKLSGKSMDGFAAKLGFFKSPDFKNKVILFHGVSVGEVIALENLIKETKNAFTEYKIVVTTGTKTGQDIALKKYQNVADFVTYFPFDAGFAIRKFLKRVKPSVILMAETEVWPNFIFECKKQNIPVYLINGRISDSSFKSYKHFKFFFRHVLKNYDGIFTQSSEDKEKMIQIGAPCDKTSVMKNLKFDVKKSDKKADLNTNNKRIIIAGSTHKEENEIILDTFIKIKEKYKDAALLLAPRHLNRVPFIESLIQKKGLKCGLKSKNEDFTNNDIVVLDTLGELSSMYSLCTFAFIGGSFNNTGGHNPLEAVVYNKPVVSGPSVKNFKDIYWLLEKSNAGKVVKNQQELLSYFDKLLGDADFFDKAVKDCKTVFMEQQGAKDFVVSKLKEIL